jgi:hypothetical protein
VAHLFHDTTASHAINIGIFVNIKKVLIIKKIVKTINDNLSKTIFLLFAMKKIFIIINKKIIK